ncbi:MAG: hypothetical protein ACRCUM_03960 [Mycoplasmoidaceae bacterium]
MIYKKLNKTISEKGVVRTTTTSDVDKAYVDNLDSQNVKLTGTQTITGGKIFNDYIQAERQIIFSSNNNWGGSIDQSGGLFRISNSYSRGNLSLSVRSDGNGQIVLDGPTITYKEPTNSNSITTKKYVDDSIANVSIDAYTKNETNNLLNEKVDNSVFNGAIDNLNNIKANLIDVYTKLETDNLLNSKTDKTYVDNSINNLSIEVLQKADIAYVDDKLDDLETSIQQDLDTLETTKQDVLVAGNNITITGNTISASGGGTPIDAYTKSETDNLLDEKADKTYADAIVAELTSKADLAYLDDIDRANVKLTGNQIIRDTKTFADGITIKSDANLSQKKIINLATPTNNNDAANKRYVDDGINGLNTTKADKAYVDDRDNFIIGGINALGQALDTKADKTYVDGLDVNNMKLTDNQELNGLKVFNGRVESNTSLLIRNGLFKLNTNTLTELNTPINTELSITNKRYVDGKDAELEARIRAIEIILNIP